MLDFLKISGILRRQELSPSIKIRKEPSRARERAKYLASPCFTLLRLASPFGCCVRKATCGGASSRGRLRPVLVAALGLAGPVPFPRCPCSVGRVARPGLCSCFGFLARPFPPSLRALRLSAPRVLAAALLLPLWLRACPGCCSLFGAGSSRAAVGGALSPFFSGCSEIRARPPPARRLRPVAASQGGSCCSLCGFVLAQAAAPSLVAAAFPFLFQLLPAAPSEASRLPKLLLPLWRQRLFRSSFGCSRLMEKLKARTRAFNFPTALLLKPPSPPAFFKMLPLFAACVWQPKKIDQPAHKEKYRLHHHGP